MNYFDAKYQMEKNIEEWKRITVLLFRINSWEQFYYFQFLDLLILLELNTDPHSVFEWLESFSEISPISLLYKNVISTMDNSGYHNAEKKELVFSENEEERFYCSLFNDVELLMDGLLFMFLSEQEQKRIMLHLLSILSARYREHIRFNYSHKELSLINNFRELSIHSKKKLLNYISSLMDQELK